MYQDSEHIRASPIGCQILCDMAFLVLSYWSDEGAQGVPTFGLLTPLNGKNSLLYGLFYLV